MVKIDIVREGGTFPIVVYDNNEQMNTKTRPIQTCLLNIYIGRQGCRDACPMYAEKYLGWVGVKF